MGLLLKLSKINALSIFDILSINSVPGVITLWSQCFICTKESGILSPFSLNKFAILTFLKELLVISCAAQNLLLHY